MTTPTLAAPRNTEEQLVRLATAFRDAAFAYLNGTENFSVCSGRTCLRCRIADAAFEVESKHSVPPPAVAVTHEPNAPAVARQSPECAGSEGKP
jgi:hypothetical protein